MPDLETIKRAIFKVYPHWVYEMEHASDGKIYAVYNRMINSGQITKGEQK